MIVAFDASAVLQLGIGIDNSFGQRPPRRIGCATLKLRRNAALSSFPCRLEGVFWLEVDLASFPFFAEFDEHGADESEQRFFVGEERCDASASRDFLVQPFDHVACS